MVDVGRAAVLFSVPHRVVEDLAAKAHVPGDVALGLLRTDQLRAVQQSVQRDPERIVPASVMHIVVVGTHPHLWGVETPVGVAIDAAHGFVQVVESCEGVRLIHGQRSGVDPWERRPLQLTGAR